MTSKTLALSVIILAYNEENQLPNCLDALAAQTVMPDEVIVVDNNSSDNTVAIALSYPFVRVVHESEQGMIPARNRGFDVASGDIFARLDADAVVSNDWAERLKLQFMDASVAAVTGPAQTKLIDGGRRLSTFWSSTYLRFASAYFGVPILWGTNMAIRRLAWLAIAPLAHKQDKAVHEDQDLSLLLAARGYKVVRDDDLVVTTLSEDYVNWDKFSEYSTRLVRTKQHHRAQGSYDTIKRTPFYKRPAALLALPIGFAWSIYAVALLVVKTAAGSNERPETGDIDL